jgi:hypothetical protein
MSLSPEERERIIESERSRIEVHRRDNHRGINL